MSIHFPCEHCCRDIRVPDDAAGLRLRCPHCRAMSHIPTESGDPLPTKPRPGLTWEAPPGHADPPPRSLVELGR